MMGKSIDTSSYSTPDTVKITHSHLDWTLDFSRTVIFGSVLHTVELINKEETVLALDTFDLVIKSIIDEENGQNLSYSVGETDADFGAKMLINLPSSKTICKIQIFYETSPSAGGLQWLEPNQTAGKKLPYVFSQLESIHARSVVPCQDTPSVKTVYSMQVNSTVDVEVVMGALRDEVIQTANGKVFKFHQPIPIPAYLIAIAAGDLVSRDIGPRSKVWSEEEFVDRAAYEFGQTEEMLKIAENLCGKYEWTQYDILVLPPSYPMGGMENPCLTFATPTLLAGDRSLADVIAHEITHSWTGNLVTNSTWADFWLNEGFTVFIEGKIQGRMNGEPARHLSGYTGWKNLAECIRVKEVDDPLTRLIPKMEGVSPEDSFSTVPYIKGSSFLWHLEELLGPGPGGEFEKFLFSYIQKFKLKSITSEDFKEYLYEYFSSKKSILDSVDWQGWWYTPGMPPQQPKFDMSLINACVDFCKQWIQLDDSAETIPLSAEEFLKFSTEQKINCLQLLLEEDPLSLKKLKKFDESYSLSAYQNAEIRCLWIRICLKGKWEDKIAPAISFVNEQGRLKFCRPIYMDLYNWSVSREKAIDNFNSHKSGMMKISVNCIKKVLHLK